MVRIKILEDDPADRQTLVDCLRKYESEHGETFSITTYANPSEFIDDYHLDCDLIFMDIELPLFNGIETAHQLREMDPVVVLVFITNMEQYAINGYEVDALDFVIKPINYCRFSSMMRRALRNLPVRDEKEVILQTAGTIMRLRASQIYYVEIRDHLLLYHTDQGRIEAWGKLSDVEAELDAYNFARCSSSHLVNLQHITSVSKTEVIVGSTALPISQRKRKAFCERVMSYLNKTSGNAR